MAADDHADSFDFPIGAQVLTAFPVPPVTCHCLPYPLPCLKSRLKLSSLLTVPSWACDLTPSSGVPGDKRQESRTSHTPQPPLPPVASLTLRAWISPKTRNPI